jgi:hypothetical protein
MNLSRWTTLIVTGTVLLSPALLRAAEEETVAERRARVAAMTPEQKEELRQKQESFVSLPTQEQERLRKLHAELTASADGAQLESVLERYHAWLATLSSGEKAELLSLPTDKRLQRIKAMMQEQEDKRFRDEVNDRLSRTDREAIVKWLLAFVDSHKQEIIDQLPQERRGPQLDHWPLMFAMLHGWAEADKKMPQPKPEEVQELIDTLSPEAQQKLTNVRDPAKRKEVAQKWISAAIASRRWRAPPPVSREELRDFYVEKLSAKERERLEALAPDEMQRALTRLYYEREMRERGPGGFPRGGGFGPRGPRRGGEDRRGDDKKGPPPGRPPEPPPERSDEP